MNFFRMSYPTYKGDELPSSQLYYVVSSTDNRNILSAKAFNSKYRIHTS